MSEPVVVALPSPAATPGLSGQPLVTTPAFPGAYQRGDTPAAAGTMDAL